MKTKISGNMKRLNHLTGETCAAYHRASMKLGLSDSVCQILYTLCDSSGSCSLTEICRLTGLTKQTVNSAVRRLEQNGTVVLEPVNARSKNVMLTEQGASFAEATAGRLIKAENEIFESWSSEDVTLYLRLTERYLNDLKEKTGTF